MNDQRSRRMILAAGLLMFAAAFPARAADTSGPHEAISNVMPKMVKIFGAGGLRGLYSYSTGFLISGEGHIVTVWSTVLDAPSVTVILDDGRRFDGEVVGLEPRSQLALLKIDGRNLPHFDLENDVAEAVPGTRVLAFSNMFKVATGDEPVSVMQGVIAAKIPLSARRGTFSNLYRGEVYVVDSVTNNPGAGGGALTNYRGELLGMIGKELRNSETNTWINYAIPVSELKPSIEEIRTGRPPEGADEGDPREMVARYTPADFGLVPLPDIVRRTPAYIDRVLPGSAAAEAGLQADDLIVFVDEHLIQSVSDLHAKLGELEPGDRFQLIVRRGDELVTVDFVAPREN